MKASAGVGEVEPKISLAFALDSRILFHALSVRTMGAVR